MINEKSMNDAPKCLDDPVASWMRELAALQPASALPDAQVVWWQAQALRRIDQQRSLTALLEVGEHIQVGCGAVAAVLLLVYLINAMPEAMSPWFALLAAGCVALVGIVVAQTIWDARRYAD